MAKPSLGAPAPSRFFTPASDQSTVSHLKVTVQFITPIKDGSLKLTVFSGNVAFGISIADLPGRPEYKLGDRLLLEYPKGQNPMTALYSAIYHADQVPQVSQPQPKKVAPMSAITPFNFDSKTIRVVTDENGEPLFVGKDVCDVLGYTNHNKAMNDHCRGVTKRYPILDSLGRTQEVRVLTEPDVYRLIVKSELPEAQKFEAWFFEEVLPTIRKTGSYTAPGSAKAAPPSIIAPSREFRALFGVGRLLGLDKNAAAISANQAVNKITGVNLLSLLGQTSMEAGNQSEMLYTPTELGKRIGVSGMAFNKMLEAAGLQKRQGDTWERTQLAETFSKIQDTMKRHSDGTPVLQLKWYPSVIQMLNLEPKAA